MRSDLKLTLAAALLLIACGGGDPAADTAAADPLAEDETAAAPAPGGNAPVEVAMAQPAFDTAAARGERPLLREVYAWRGGVRDPFRPLMSMETGGPELTDMVLTSVLYQPRDPSRSVAIFRDNGNNKRYTVSPGDRIGRLAVVSIQEGRATLRLN
ncbi:MAG TPA: hypothetical protein PLL69_08155, partial [Gemmatimonadales bacterium]|nr:hypothetical protein [Gemmatimonadales bacterium]